MAGNYNTYDDAQNLLVANNGGFTATQTWTPSAAAYSAGDIMSVAKLVTPTYSNSATKIVPAGSLLRITTAVVKIDVTSVPSGQTTYTLQCYNVTPPSAQADNDTWTLASGDLPSYLGAIPLGAPLDFGAALYVKTPYVDFDMRLITNGFYAELVTVGAHTAAAIARTITLHGFVL